MTEEINVLDNEGLKRLKQQWYNAAVNDGTIQKFWKIAKQLGRSLESNKWEWKHEDICIYADGYGNYLTVRVGGKQVVSTHSCTKLFVRGDWLSRILPFVSKAEQIELQKKQQQYLAERQELLRELGLLN